MTDSQTTSSQSVGPRPPITDKLWFWLLIYGSMAVLALAAISPKHAKRQERLDRMSNARQEVWRKQVEGRAPAEAEDAPRDYSQPLSDDKAAGEISASESFDESDPATRAFDPLPMLLIVAAVVWLAGSLAMIYLPRLSRRYYPRFTSHGPVVDHGEKDL